jgi:hypothetical protein
MGGNAGPEYKDGEPTSLLLSLKAWGAASKADAKAKAKSIHCTQQKEVIIMQIPILSGIFTDNGPDFRTSYPVNLVPTPKQSGISTGYLRPGDGIVANGTGPGADRGGINWRGQLYRVMGTKLVEISSAGVVTTLRRCWWASR